MKILITGNLGYVGTITTEYLKNQGYDVVGLDSGFYRECLLVPIENKIITDDVNSRCKLKDAVREYLKFLSEVDNNIGFVSAAKHLEISYDYQ